MCELLLPSSYLPEYMPVHTSHRVQVLMSRLADGMDRFHNHFRFEFNRVYTVSYHAKSLEGIGNKS